jgi:hypothetical protein
MMTDRLPFSRKASSAASDENIERVKDNYLLATRDILFGTMSK